MSARRWLVRGVVQGVGFRWFVLREADRFGLSGYVRNDRDGAVEVVAQGSEDALGRLEAALRRGPSMARVERVEKYDVPHEMDIPNAFEIR